MCRMFAVRADRPVRAETALLTGPHALVRQSCCDLRGECHQEGWGVGYYADGKPVRVRSARHALADPLFAETARTVASTTLIGHVRQASVGGAAERNNHPFVHGRWLFAHNGTLVGFADDPEPLRRLIPDRCRRLIDGETDSEHVFAYLLGRLEGPTDPDAVGRVLADAAREIARLYPGTADEPTRLNFVLTDGELLAATRWGHSLHLFDGGPGPFDPADGGPPGRVVAAASEPITPDGWRPLDDRSLIVVRPNLSVTIGPA